MTNPPTPTMDLAKQVVERILREQIYLQRLDDDARVVGYENATAILLDLITSARSVGGDVVGWASEWQGVGGLSRAFHQDKHEAADNAKWMHGRSFAVVEAGGGPLAPLVPTEQADRAVLTGPMLEAIAHNLCSLHDFDPAFVAGQERFARAVITEYERARPAPDFALDGAGTIAAVSPASQPGTTAQRA